MGIISASATLCNSVYTKHPEYYVLFAKLLITFVTGKHLGLFLSFIDEDALLVLNGQRIASDIEDIESVAVKHETAVYH